MPNNQQAVYDTIQAHFRIDKGRIRFLTMLIIALLKRAHSSLAQGCLAINQPTQRSARFKRVQRFLGQFNRFGGPIFSPHLRPSNFASLRSG